MTFVNLRRPNGDKKPYLEVGIAAAFVLYLTYCVGYNSSVKGYGEDLSDYIASDEGPRHVRRMEAAVVPTLSNNPLNIPQGEAKALPSIRVEVEEVNRGHYGGEGDKQHLGGFTKYDGMGVSPATWRYMMNYFGVKSLIDVGCGKVSEL